MSRPGHGVLPRPPRGAAPPAKSPLYTLLQPTYQDFVPGFGSQAETRKPNAVTKAATTTPRKAGGKSAARKKGGGPSSHRSNEDAGSRSGGQQLPQSVAESGGGVVSAHGGSAPGTVSAVATSGNVGEGEFSDHVVTRLQQIQRLYQV